MSVKKVEDCIYVFKKNCQSLLGKHSLNDNILNFNLKDGSLSGLQSLLILKYNMCQESTSKFREPF